MEYSPEREDPGRADRSVGRIPKLVGGTDAASAAAAAELYRRIVPEVVEVSSCEVAEASKLCENIFRSVNIALVNELKGSLGAMGLDVWEVIDAASTKPFGFMRFEPGPGLGGHCIPIDPYYLAWRAKQAGAESRFIELAGDVNRAMPNTVVGATARALEARGVAPASARVLVLGLAYKPNVDDPRESPSFELIEGLRARGCAVEYHDPHIPVAPKGRRYDLKLESIDLTDEALASYDAVLIATAHDAYDWHSILAASRLLVDTRGVTRRLPDPEGKVVRA